MMHKVCEESRNLAKAAKLHASEGDNASTGLHLKSTRRTFEVGFRPNGKRSKLGELVGSRKFSFEMHRNLAATHLVIRSP